MAISDFPEATKAPITHLINERYFTKVSRAAAADDASAIRAKVKQSNGDWKVEWFVPIELPAGYVGDKAPADNGSNETQQAA